MDFKLYVRDHVSNDIQVRLKAFDSLLKGRFHYIDFAPRTQLKGDLPGKILIGTYHKTGTVWLKTLFQSICRYYSLKFYTERSYFESSVNDLSEIDVFLQCHSVFNFDSIGALYRGIHIIRDPRDVILSACFYHQKSDEAWLHEPRKEFNGLTYQQKINTYEDMDDKLLFEMEYASKSNVEKMLAWDYANPLFYEIKYESLIEDVNLTIFHELFLFLGFPGYSIPILLQAAYEKSLFSGQYGKSVHIRSGKKRQWKKYFKSVHQTRFIDLFGDNALIKLGYETNNGWA